MKKLLLFSVYVLAFTATIQVNPTTAPVVFQLKLTQEALHQNVVYIE